MRIIWIVGKRIRKVISGEGVTKILVALDPENHWFFHVASRGNLEDNHPDDVKVVLHEQLDKK